MNSYTMLSNSDRLQLTSKQLSVSDNGGNPLMKFLN